MLWVYLTGAAGVSERYLAPHCSNSKEFGASSLLPSFVLLAMDDRRSPLLRDSAPTQRRGPTAALRQYTLVMLSLASDKTSARLRR